MTRSKLIPALLGAAAVAVIIVALIYVQGQKNTGEQPVPAATDAVAGSTPPSATPEQTMATNTNPDLTPDANGLSQATVVMTTTQGVIKYKFYTADAPNTVKRMVELINQGFYNGLTFHRVEPDFVIQGGDPLGNGMGGSGQKLKAEFNARRHLEGAVAMARARDPDSADSQFYVSLGTHPHLDRNYTVFGQVTEGMDVARKIRVGDKMTSLIIQ
jgi:peptidylprolyl isomerase